MFIFFVIVRSTVVFLLAFCLTILQSKRERREFRSKDSQNWRMKMYLGSCGTQGKGEQVRGIEGDLPAKTTSATGGLQLQDK